MLERNLISITSSSSTCLDLISQSLFVSFLSHLHQVKDISVTWFEEVALVNWHFHITCMESSWIALCNILVSVSQFCLCFSGQNTLRTTSQVLSVYFFLCGPIDFPLSKPLVCQCVVSQTQWDATPWLNTDMGVRKIFDQTSIRSSKKNVVRITLVWGLVLFSGSVRDTILLTAC